MKNQTNTNKYNLTNDVIKKEVDDILKGKYQQCVLGTLDQNGYPYLSKTLPLYYEKKIYLLLSDLSDHTENLKNLQIYPELLTCLTSLLVIKHDRFSNCIGTVFGWAGFHGMSGACAGNL